MTPYKRLPPPVPTHPPQPPAPPPLPPYLLAEDDVAEQLGLAPSTLRKWRTGEPSGPAFIKLGRNTVRYRQADVDAWVASQVHAHVHQYQELEDGTV